MGLVAFTDGSFIDQEGTDDGMCGYAAVMCRVEDYLNPDYDFEAGTYVVLKGAAPLAGANYTAEVKALLAVLHAVPVNVPLLCISDALSALQVLWKPTIANGARIRLGSRALSSAARDLIKLRSAYTITECTHVHSHSGGNGIDARGNAIADTEANDAATQSPPCGPALATEEPYVFWEDEIFHVHGDLRKSLRDRATADYARSWGEHRTQGSITRLSSPKRVLSLIRLVRRTRDAPLLTFCLKAITLQVSTSDKMRYRAEKAPAGTEPSPKPTWTCTCCEATLAYSGRAAHRRSKKHRAAHQAAAKAKRNRTNPPPRPPEPTPR